MKKIIIIFVVILALVTGFYALNYYIYQEKQAPEEIQITDSSFGPELQYSCMGNKTFTASFAYNLARISLQDKRVFTLENISFDEEAGAKFANENNEIALWVREESGFVEEKGIPTYESCRMTLPDDTI